MIQVSFPEHVDDALLRFAVIIARTGGQWILCKHRERTTYEFPGGRREEGETIEQTARRELNEETGAIDFDLSPVCAYAVKGKTRFNQTEDSQSFGMLYVADVHALGDFHSEIEKILLTDDLNVDWTYPLIQPQLMQEAKRRGIV